VTRGLPCITCRRRCGPRTSRCGRWRRCCARSATQTLRVSETRRVWRGMTDALAQVVARWAEAHPGQRLVLTIDQFEELATLWPRRRRAGAFPALAGRGRPGAARHLAADHHAAHRLRAAVYPRGRAAGWVLAGEPLRRAAHGHRGPASGDRGAGLGAGALLRPARTGGRPDQGGDPDPWRAAAALLHPERAVRQVRAQRPGRPGAVGADYQALGGVVGSLRNRASEEYDRLPDDATVPPCSG
jgi:hypothetical protein